MNLPALKIAQTQQASQTRWVDPKKINYISGTVLAVGLAAGCIIYFTAGPETLDPLGDQYHSKKYIHELGVIGGKSNIMTAEFIEWVKSLFVGPTLGITLAVFAVVFVVGFRFLASLPDPDAPASIPTPPRPGGSTE